MKELQEFGSEFKIVGQLLDSEQISSLQRTEEWYTIRRGKFTGSNMKLLMGCGRASSKMPWTTNDKIVDFGATAEKYIYGVGGERTTGCYSMQIDSKQMQYGRMNEIILINKLLKDNIISNYEAKSFELFYKNAGASVDGLCVFKNEEMCLEVKCTVSWDGHYERMYEEQVDQTHCDFWQMQAEMMAAGTDKCLYVVAYPMTIEKYKYQIVNASKIHQKAIMQRCQIADEAIKLWNTHSYTDSLKIACQNFKFD
ncbi:MAG TPA: hypothetical protein DC057_05080 [Spirochaetia bacterium]|nr:hypothetical protein [Spirochaetia bacterium]